METGLAAAAGTLIGIVLTRMRCILTHERCGCGYTDKSLFPGSDTELRVVRLNGVDIAYVVTGGMEGSENEDEDT